MNENNKYNGLNHTFVSEPLINQLWADLSNDDIGTTPVTLGTDNWFPLSDPDQLPRRPLYNRLGSGGDITNYFYKHDRIYLNDLTVFCNFADGLLKNSDVTLTPAEVVDNDPLPDYVLTNKLKLQVISYYQQVSGAVAIGSAIFPINHFNTVNQLGIFAPEAPDSILDTTVCQWVELALFHDESGNNPSYSTKSINTAFQSDRCLVWCEANISHTFNTSDRDDVIAESTGWPT